MSGIALSGFREKDTEYAGGYHWPKSFSDSDFTKTTFSNPSGSSSLFASQEEKDEATIIGDEPCENGNQPKETSIPIASFKTKLSSSQSMNDFSAFSRVKAERDSQLSQMLCDRTIEVIADRFQTRMKTGIDKDLLDDIKKILLKYFPKSFSNSIDWKSVRHDWKHDLLEKSFCYFFSKSFPKDIKERKKEVSKLLMSRNALENKRAVFHTQLEVERKKRQALPIKDLQQKLEKEGYTSLDDWYLAGKRKNNEKIYNLFFSKIVERMRIDSQDMIIKPALGKIFHSLLDQEKWEGIDQKFLNNFDDRFHLFIRPRHWAAFREVSKEVFIDTNINQILQQLSLKNPDLFGLKNQKVPPPPPPKPRSFSFLSEETKQNGKSECNELNSKIVPAINGISSTSSLSLDIGTKGPLSPQKKSQSFICFTNRKMWSPLEATSVEDLNRKYGLDEGE